MGWSYLRNKSLPMDFRHALWLEIMDANLYVESCDQSPTVKSNFFLELHPIMESGTRWAPVKRAVKQTQMSPSNIRCPESGGASGGYKSRHL